MDGIDSPSGFGVTGVDGGQAAVGRQLRSKIVMPALKSDLPMEQGEAERPRMSLAPMRGMVLARIAAHGGATRAGIIRDLAQMTAHRLSPGEWRQRAETELTALLAARLIVEHRGRYNASEIGRSAAEEFLGHRMPAKAGWVDVRDVHLVANALGIGGASQANIKALGKPEGLRALIVQKAFGLPLKGNQSASRLRAELAVLALERAFGNKIKRGLGAGSGLSSKAGRVLAGQLSRRPQDYGTDGRLVAQLAAEHAGATQADPDALRLALLRSLVLPASAGAPVAVEEESAASRPVKTDEKRQAANDAGPAIGVATPRPALPVQRPDMDAFAGEVKAAARKRAEGWPGNRKAYISHVWGMVRDGRPEWALTEIEFKCMLAEAHRAGHVTLASADLKDKRNMQDLQDSAIGYKNTVWHLVRVED